MAQREAPESESRAETAPTTDRHRVLIVGGGFGGVNAAKALKRAPVDITLVDRTNHHLFQPLLYQVATGILSSGEVAPALRSMFRGQQNVRVLLGNVIDLDLEARRAHAMVFGGEPLTLPYDTLVVAGGATHSYFGHPEWATYAPGMKTLDDAARLRSRILGAFEVAEHIEAPAEREAWMTFVIVGAGPTGVELAGQIALLSRRILRDEYRAINPPDARIILLDAAPAVLGSFAEKLQGRAERDLRKMGVEIRLGAAAVGIDPDGIDVKADEAVEHIPAKTIIWAAGVEASPLAGMLAESTGAELDRAGRVAVQPDCTLPGHPEVFAIGDMVALNGLPGVAQPAMQEGKYIAKVLRARLDGKPAPPPFKYFDKGSMAMIGRTNAVADAFGVKLGGLPAFMAWAFIHITYLVGWGNRFGAMLRWTWSLVARNRRERLISLVSLVSEERAEEEVARVALEYKR
jgi:NADH dehydrogenase